MYSNGSISNSFPQLRKAANCDLRSEARVFSQGETVRANERHCELLALRVASIKVCEAQREKIKHWLEQLNSEDMSAA